MTDRRTVLLVAITMALGACAGEASSTSTAATVAEPSPPAIVSEDRSLDVSYSDDLIELSFARLDHPFRAMHAKVLTWSDEGWTYYGILRSENANTDGILTTEPEESVEVLDGVNTAPTPDRYDAPGLPSDRYLVCAVLAESDNHNEVCGEFAVD